MAHFARKQILSLATLILVGIAGFTIYQLALNSSLRVTSTTPNIKGSVSTSTNGFRINFNRELDQTIDYMQNLSDSNGQVHEIVVEGTSILIVTEAHSDGSKHKFEIVNIKDKNGSTMGRLEFDYSVKVVAFDRLSKEHQSLIQEIARRPLSHNPIISYLPYSTLNFKLDREFADEHESGEIGEFVLIAELFLSAADVRIDRTAAVERYKKEVQDYIISLGFSPSDYTITYREVEL